MNQSDQSTALARIARTDIAVREPRTATLVKPTPRKALVYDNLQQRGNGVWYYRKGKDIKSTTFKDYDSARQWRDKYVAQQEDRKRESMGIAPKTPRAIPTVQEWFTRYWAKYSVQKATPRSDQRARPFMEAHAGKYLTEITASHCQDWIVARTGSIIPDGLRNAGKPRSDESVSIECVCLKAIFQKAIEEGVYPAPNPWKGKNGPGRVFRESVLSNVPGKKGAPSDQDRLFAELERVRYGRGGAGGAHHAALRAVKTILGSGLRLAELRRLRPCDVLKDGLGGSGWVIDVYRGKGGAKSGTRKQRKTRYVPIHPATAAVLDAQRLAQGLDEEARTPYWPYSACWLDRILQLACEQAKVVVLVESEDPDEAPSVRGGITPHDLRRTYATRLAKSGKVVPKVLQQLMGHSSYEITMRHYQGFGNEDRIEVVRSVDLGLTT